MLTAGTNPDAARKRKPGQDAARFQTDDSGKMIIEESGDEEEHGTARAVEGGAFMAAQRGTDGQSRDTRGNLRFNRNTKRARDEERMDVDGEEGTGAAEKLVDRRKKRQQMGKLGDEFKAKVSGHGKRANVQRAGGDVKRQGGPDPYSYVPIGQATKGKKGSKDTRVNLTNKKKGSSGRR